MTHLNRRATTRVIVVAVAAIALTTVARGQSEKWYPSRWGADDQRGAANRITPAKVLQAKALITHGRIYQLGRVYEAGMPLPATRHFSLHIPQAYVLGGKNQAVYHDEVVSAEIGQIGTQFDGLGHFGQGELFYNGNRRSEFAQPGGLTRLGIENVGPIFTRGVLIDVARLRGVAQLAGGYEITVADLKNALAKAASRSQRGRRRVDSHGLGRAVDEGQCEVHGERASTRHRDRRGAVLG